MFHTARRVALDEVGSVAFNETWKPFIDIKSPQVHVLVTTQRLSHTTVRTARQ
jgi:hypothetical protein